MALSKEAQVLIKLIRLALRTEPLRYFGEPAEPFPSDIDWKEVIRLSYEHKVSALAVDGLHSVNYDPYEGLDETKKEELKSILTPWIEDVNNLEKEYEYYLEVIQFLGQLFASHGLKMILLKGAGLALNYPTPFHRGAGDIDFYLLDEDNQPAAKQGDELMQSTYSEMFHPTEHHQNTYHTQYSFKGIIIENHYNIIGEFYNHDLEHHLQIELERLIAQGIKPYTNVFLPSADFNALFLIKHMFGHCYFGGINLRQLIDYHTCTRHNLNDVDWNLVKKIEQESELGIFASYINHIDEVLLSNKITYFKTSRNFTPMDLIADMFVQKSNRRGIYNFFHWYKDRKKIHFLTGENWIKLTLRSSKEHINNAIKK